MNVLVLLSVLAVAAPINSVPLSERDAPGSGFVKQNGLDAQKQNAQFLTMKSSDACQCMFPISFVDFFKILINDPKPVALPVLMVALPNASMENG